MPSFAERSYQKELLDSDGLPFADIRQNMLELDLINRRLGGHRISVRGLKALLPQEDRPVSVLEIGCGGGDNLRALKQWAGYDKLRLQGVDVNPECISYARSQPRNRGIEFFVSDYRLFRPDEQPDIIFSSLFCHHFRNEELVQMLGWMRANSRVGFFINDLHRHPLAFYSIRLLTRLFSRSYLVRNDAPLSVQRGFVRSDWTRLFSEAGISTYRCRWQWAFRWLVTCPS